MTATRILITGCSGGGKSTLLAELARRGHTCVAEPGRRVIEQQRASGGGALPWSDPAGFARACLAMAERDWAGAGPGVTFYDRGIVDAALALRRAGAGQAGEAALARFRYVAVFLAPPWPELFASAGDPDRRHGMTEAIAEYDDIVAGLAVRGIVGELLPKAGVAARADWLETRLRTGYGLDDITGARP